MLCHVVQSLQTRRTRQSIQLHMTKTQTHARELYTSSSDRLSAFRFREGGIMVECIALQPQLRSPLQLSAICLP